jgi:hypothetical protein
MKGVSMNRIASFPFLRSRLAPALAVASVALTAAHAIADIEKEPHLDLWITASAGTLVTGGWDHDTGEVVNASQRVFEGELGLDPFFPFSGDEPGIGSDLVGTTLAMNLLPTLDAWNGSSFVRSTSMLTASYAGQSATSGTGGSFSFLVSAGLDLHPEFTLSGQGATDPANGIYLAAFRVSAAGFGQSDTFWIVFNLGMPEADHEAAVEWVESNLVPAPGALAMLALGTVMARSRTRRR